MVCCQIYVQDGDSLPYSEEHFNSRRGHRLQLDASEGPEYSLELDDERFTIPTWSMLNRPSSPSESVSEESMSLHSEESLSDDDEDWQESDGLAQRVISMILKIFDDQKNASQLENQEQKLWMASGGGGGQPEQPEQQQEADPMEDADEEQVDAEDEEEDVGDVPANPAPIQRRRGTSDSVAGLGRDSNDSNDSDRSVPADMENVHHDDEEAAPGGENLQRADVRPIHILEHRVQAAMPDLYEAPNPPINQVDVLLANYARVEMELEGALIMAMGQHQRQQEVAEQMEVEENVEDYQEEANPKRKRQYDGGADSDQKRRRGNDDGAGSSGAVF